MKHLLYFVMVCPTVLVHAQHCQIAGHVYFTDVVDHTITVKTDSGDLVNFGYNEATVFVHAGSPSHPGADRVAPEQLNNGDRLCVGTPDSLTVTITPRTEIDAQQKRELATWQADSFYGVVSAVDKKARQITLSGNTSDTKKSYSFEVSPNAMYWLFPRNAVRLSDATTGSLDRVAPGDPLYVRGTKAGGDQKFLANLIVSGGFNSFAAVIETVEPLDELLHVHLLLSGNPRTVHINPGELYAIGQAESAAAGESRLRRIADADLQPGDTVLILGTDDGQNSLRAFALIAGFSPFGVLPPDPSQQMRWIFDNVPLR